MSELKLPTKADWCAALRSGEYHQTEQSLKSPTWTKGGIQVMGFCCLGVYKDLVQKANPDTAIITDQGLLKDSRQFEAELHSEIAPEQDTYVPVWALARGLTCDIQDDLAAHNDGRAANYAGRRAVTKKSFNEIADIIEADIRIK